MANVITKPPVMLKPQKQLLNQATRKGIIEDWVLHDNLNEEEVTALFSLSFENMPPDVQQALQVHLTQVRDAPEGFLRDRAIKNLQDYLAKQFPSSKWDYFWTLHGSSILLGFTTQSIAIVSSFFNVIGIFVAMAGVALITPRPRVALKVLGVTFLKSIPRATWQVLDVLLKGEDGGNNVVGILDKETIIDRRGKIFYKRTIEDISREVTNPVLKVVYWVARLADRIAVAADTFMFQANQDMTLGSLLLTHQQKVAFQHTDEELYEMVVASMYASNYTTIYEQAAKEVHEKTDRKDNYFVFRQDLDTRRRAYEIAIQQATTPNEREEAKEVGLFNTLKNTPVGLLGLVATRFELFLEKRAFTKTVGRLVVGTDFIRTTTNALNLTLDYSLYGFWRAFRPTIRQVTNRPTLFSSYYIKKQMEIYGIKSSTQGETDSYTRKLQVAKALIGTVYQYALADLVSSWLG